MLTDIKIQTATDLHEFLVQLYTECRVEETRERIIEQIIQLTNEIRGIE